MEVYPIDARQARPLRAAVLRPGLPAELSVYPLDDDPASFHAGVFADGALIGVASVFNEAPSGESPTTEWRLRGVAVDEPYRNRGIGEKMMSVCIAYVSEADGTEIWCNARERARTFYERLGFRVEGERYEDPVSGPHYRMRKQL